MSSKNSSYLNPFSIFKKKADLAPLTELKVDIHSHLIPAIDDGVQSIEESLDILKKFEALGYKKVITTPHTMAEFYANTPKSIGDGLAVMQKAIATNGLNIQLEAATEYYLDEHFVSKIDQDEPLMAFGDKYVLVETGFINQPPELKEVSFKLSMKGYKMVYAHPERYLYLQENKQLIEELMDRKVIFQLNAVSLTGCYGKPIQKFAERLIEMGVIQMVGSDCHNIRQFGLLQQAKKSKYWDKLLRLDLLNNTL